MEPVHRLGTGDAIRGLMDPGADRGDHVRQLRFFVAFLLLVPALVSGYVIAGGCEAMGLILPFTAAVLAFPATLRSRTMGIALGVLSLSGLNLIRIASLYRFNDIVRVLMATLAIVGFVAWARWASHETR